MVTVTDKATDKVRRDRGYLVFTIVVIVVAAAVDQLSKALILAGMEPGGVVPLIGDWFRFHLVFNPGAAFSFGTSFTWVFTAIQLIFVVGILWHSPRVDGRLAALGLALVAGGAAGNLTDRLFRDPGFFVGHVVDFISVGDFAVFNVADSCITVGVLVFLLSALLDARAGSRDTEVAA
ncbi:signal peptidase II [Corynebacterium sp. CCM 8835]|uniref:Lipoprotein signal peptidase n=1 Tax=Corynebacterium antarcticum TaxID=2800405 RepID=A0A9Q4CBH6_9CORY|nr:signal peptidase II [Corynebacterium antarcticum]MCK7641781.1 signal peptidase II [Corynebacterium antarcticum]MCK7660123.1 signal peptidase II [Corynebacterium antarcticum]MCL0245010.1 signal peptidase II [Corynebacterium antarcticum]MCX7491384.1 signal peptidase II [Corynebacterium antarcticum]MCX7537403.1 signal peptidase II [Corynebacterium antarcticum]